MSNRASDPRAGYRRHGAHTDARTHFDYPTSDRQRPFGQEESNRNAPNRNAKYYDMDPSYRSRLTKDRHSSKDKEIQDFELNSGSNKGSTRSSFVSQSEMHKQSGGDPTYKLNATKNMSVEDEDMFLYGSETSGSVYLKDYMHGQTEPQKSSVDDGDLSISEAMVAATTGKQDYDPTIENILKSIGFNIDLSQAVTESTSKAEATVEQIRAAAIQTSEPSITVSEALSTSTLRMGFSKKIDSILPAQETYEARAKRYREEQTRLYAESNASIDLLKAVPQLAPVASGRSSLELLQSSYDYDAVVKEFAKEIESKEVQRDNRAGNKSEPDNAESRADPTGGNRAKRALYEDFSDSDDNLSDSEKPIQTEMRKGVDHFKGESHHLTVPSPRFRDETEGKKSVRSGKEAKTKAAEPSSRNSNAERISGATRTSKNVRESEVIEMTSRQVKIIPSTTASESGSGRSGSVRYVVGSKWDSPKRDEPVATETGTRTVVDLKLMEKRQLKLQSLNIELDRLKQEQKEMMRRKQRGRLGLKDPELLGNSHHQVNICSEIDRLMKCTDEEFLELDGREAKRSPSTERKVVVTSRHKVESSTITPEVSGIKSEKKSDFGHKDRPKLQKMVVHYDYFDDGSHWCRSCNAIFTTIDELCQHLHSSKHHEKMDSSHQPWAPKVPVITKGFKGVPVPIKGVEFLMSCQAFYCSLCSVFSGDAQCAHDHLKSNEHNENYQRFLENDTTYEHHYNLDKEAAMSLIGKMELENRKDTGTQKLGSSIKRPSFLRPSNDNTKRAKLSSESSERAPNDDCSDMHDTKSDASPADDKVSNALLDGSRSSDRSGKAKDAASKAPCTLPSKTAVTQKKPAFIGKLPCLTGARNRSSVSRFSKTNGIDVKESNECSDTKKTLLSVVETSQVQEGIGESQNEVTSSTLCRSEDNLTTMNKSCPVPVNDLQEGDDGISTAIGQRLAAIKNSKSSVECNRDSSGQLEKAPTTEPKKLDSSGVTEVMSLGDFEIFDECDAE